MVKDRAQRIDIARRANRVRRPGRLFRVGEQLLVRELACCDEQRLRVLARGVGEIQLHIQGLEMQRSTLTAMQNIGQDSGQAAANNPFLSQLRKVTVLTFSSRAASFMVRYCSDMAEAYIMALVL